MVNGNIVKNTQDYVNWDHYRNVDQSRTRVSRDEADIKEALAQKSEARGLYSLDTVNRRICHIDRRTWLFQTSSTPSWRRYSCLWQLREPCCQPKHFDSTGSIDA